MWILMNVDTSSASQCWGDIEDVLQTVLISFPKQLVMELESAPVVGKARPSVVNLLFGSLILALLLSSQHSVWPALLALAVWQIRISLVWCQFLLVCSFFDSSYSTLTFNRDIDVDLNFKDEHASFWDTWSQFMLARRVYSTKRIVYEAARGWQTVYPCTLRHPFAWKDMWIPWFM